MAIDKILKLSDIQEMPTHVLLAAYREGYRLEATNNLIRNLASESQILKMDTTKTFTANVTGGSGSPITYHWKITKPDGTIDTSPTTSVVNYTFTALGDYKVEVFATADCQGTLQTSPTQSATITVNSTGVVICDQTKNYLIFGKCVPKTMAYIGGAILGAILLGQ